MPKKRADCHAKGVDDAITGDTIFEVGSITKVFTSLILADMVVHGEVKLDTPVAQLLPPTLNLPQRNGKQITLRTRSPISALLNFIRFLPATN